VIVFADRKIRKAPKTQEPRNKKLINHTKKNKKKRLKRSSFPYKQDLRGKLNKIIKY